jgi:hypothetical protein
MQPGDRIAFTRAFVASLGNDYGTAQQRGVFVSDPAPGSTLARVRWDDDGPELYRAHAEQYGHDFADDEFFNGSSVHFANICGIKTKKFIEIA